MRTIPKKEDLFTEFKSDTKEKNGLPDSELIDAIVGMTNAEGGILYLGVEDDGEITGLTKQHKDAIGVMALIANSTVPTVSTRAEIITENKKDILRIEVPKARTVTATSRGKTLRRRLKFDGSPEVVPLFPYEITSRLSELSLLDFSAQPLEGATDDDLDNLEFERLRNIIKNNIGSDKSLLELNQEDFYKALHFVVEENGKIIPTVTGLLFLGKTESLKRLIPTYRASFQVLSGTNVKINETSNEPLVKIFEKFYTYFQAWNPEKEMEYGLFRIPVPEFTPGAFREGLLNAFCHRDYTQLGQVRVLIDDEGLTISSQGGFIEGVNSENLIFVEPHGRNPCLSDVLKRVGLAEKTGRGIDRIYEGSILYGRPWPDYSESTSSIVKLFVSRANPDMQFTKMIADEQNRRNQPLSINALMILSTIRNERRVTAERLSEVIHLNKSRTSSTIENLVEAGLVEAIGNGVNRSYILSAKVYKQNNESVKYVRQTDIDAVRYPELIIKLAKQQDGVITKEDVAELLKITDVQAYLQIKKLLTEGKLVPNQKGKYANYKLKD
ncbi:MAG: putative DNA binding domain-containing protein [Treponemataceae bacterium]|nr:putative DNA binding domain-containing protein [Treponemataceae bacterium]